MTTHDDFTFNIKELQNNIGNMDEPWYNLSQGGYIKPSELLECKDLARRVEEAAALVQMFFEAMEYEIEALEDDGDDE